MDIAYQYTPGKVHCIVFGGYLDQDMANALYRRGSLRKIGTKLEVEN